MLTPGPKPGWGAEGDGIVQTCPPMIYHPGSLGPQATSHRNSCPEWSVSRANRTTDVPTKNRKGQLGNGEKPPPGEATAHGWGSSALQPCPNYPGSLFSGFGNQPRSVRRTEPRTCIGTSVNPERRAFAASMRPATSGSQTARINRASYESPLTEHRCRPTPARTFAPRVQTDIKAEKEFTMFYEKVQRSSSFGDQIKTQRRTEPRCRFGSSTSPERIPFRRGPGGVCNWDPSRAPATTRLSNAHPTISKGARNFPEMPSSMNSQLLSRASR